MRGSDGLYLLPVNGGEPRALPIPQEAGRRRRPWFAPDGRHLAYHVRRPASRNISPSSIWAPTTCRPERPGASRDGRSTPDGGYAWTRDGKSLLYVELGIHRLWRVEVTGDRAPQPVEIAGFGAIRPAIAASRDRLVFVKEHDGHGHLPVRGRAPGRARDHVDIRESNPQFSPDGRRVVFESERSGEARDLARRGRWFEPDASSPTGRGSCKGRPAGRRTAGGSPSTPRARTGGYDIWTIDADGASPRRLTQDPGDENLPSWSRDGRFIYFAARPEALQGFDVWRIPAAGGAEERMTRRGRLRRQRVDRRQDALLHEAPARCLAAPRPVARRRAGTTRSRSAWAPPSPWVRRGSIPWIARTRTRARPSSCGIRRRAEGGSSESWIGRVSPMDSPCRPTARRSSTRKLVDEGSDLMMIENFRRAVLTSPLARAASARYHSGEFTIS